MLEKVFIKSLYTLSVFIYKNLFLFFPNIEGIVIAGSRNCPSFRMGVSDVDISVFFKNNTSDRVINIANFIHTYFCKCCPIIDHYCIPIRVCDFKEYVRTHPAYHLWYHINKDQQIVLKGIDPSPQLDDLPMPDIEFAISQQIKMQWFLINHTFSEKSPKGINLFYLKKSLYKLIKLKEFQQDKITEVDFNNSDPNYFFKIALDATEDIY